MPLCTFRMRIGVSSLYRILLAFLDLANLQPQHRPQHEPSR